MEDKDGIHNNEFRKMDPKGLWDVIGRLNQVGIEQRIRRPLGLDVENFDRTIESQMQDELRYFKGVNDSLDDINIVARKWQNA